MHRITGRTSLAFVGIAALLGMGALTWDAVTGLQPAYKRKTVTLRAATGQSHKVVFSALQTDPEVLYEIKTVHQPHFDRDLDGLNDQVDDGPFRRYTRQALLRRLQTHGSAAAALILCAAGLSRFGHRRRRNDAGQDLKPGA